MYEVMCLSRFAALAARIIVLLQEGNVGLALSSQTPASNLHWLTLAELASLSDIIDGVNITGTDCHCGYALAGT